MIKTSIKAPGKNVESTGACVGHHEGKPVAYKSMEQELRETFGNDSTFNMKELCEGTIAVVEKPYSM